METIHACQALDSLPWSVCAVGFGASLITGMGAVRLFFWMLDRRTLRPFAWYCMVVAISFALDSDCQMKKKKTAKPIHNEAKGLFLIAFGFLMLVSLFSFNMHHLSGNWLGFLGYTWALIAEYGFGLGAYLIPCYLFWWGSRLMSAQKPIHAPAEHLYFLILLGSICILFNVLAEYLPDRAAAFEDKVITETIVLQSPYPRTVVRFNLGGVPFYFIYCDLPLVNLQHILSTVGTTLIFSILVLVSFLLLTRVRILTNLRILGHAIVQLIQSSMVAANPKKPPINEKGLPPVYSGLSKEPPKTAIKNSAAGRKTKKSSCYRNFS